MLCSGILIPSCNSAPVPSSTVAACESMSARDFSFSAVCISSSVYATSLSVSSISRSYPICRSSASATIPSMFVLDIAPSSRSKANFSASWCSTNSTSVLSARTGNTFPPPDMTVSTSKNIAQILFPCFRFSCFSRNLLLMVPPHFSMISFTQNTHNRSVFPLPAQEMLPHSTDLPVLISLKTFAPRPPGSAVR